MTYDQYIEQYKQRALRKCQLKQVAILEVIDHICRSHGIDYWIDSGTLLGAVRHGGFIPWDDDIDIAMTADGLERFKQVAPALLPPTLVLQTPESVPESKEPIVKVRDLDSFYVEPGDDFSANYPKGLFVDIFPFVDYPTVSRPWVKRVARMLSRSRSILRKPHRYSFRAVAEWFWFGAKYLVARALWHGTCLMRPKGTYMSFDVTLNGYGVMQRKDSIFPLSTITFEGKEFACPNNVDDYLRTLYGDYMQIPPEGQRHIHAVFMMERLGNP